MTTTQASEPSADPKETRMEAMTTLTTMAAEEMLAGHWTDETANERCDRYAAAIRDVDAAGIVIARDLATRMVAAAGRANDAPDGDEYDDVELEALRELRDLVIGRYPHGKPLV